MIQNGPVFSARMHRKKHYFLAKIKFLLIVRKKSILENFREISIENGNFDLFMTKNGQFRRGRYCEHRKSKNGDFYEN